MLHMPGACVKPLGQPASASICLCIAIDEASTSAMMMQDTRDWQAFCAKVDCTNSQKQNADLLGLLQC